MSFAKNILLAKLPYKFNALEPYISEEALRLHYKKHNWKYVDELNKLKRGTPYDGLTLEEIILGSSSRARDPKARSENDIKIFNNASQAWNHDFFWQCLSAKHNLSLSENLNSKLSEAFDSLSNFKEQFVSFGLDQFGSGWVWLVENNKRGLEIISTNNAGSPMELKDLKPLLVCDIWEHAYYLDYRGDRRAYLDNFWPLVNWKFVESRMATKVPFKESHGA